MKQQICAKNKVMIVDDTSTMRMYVRSILETYDFEVHQACSGKECIEKLQKGFKGLILMDVVMPDLDGWDTIREIVSANLIEGNIVCMLTAKNDPGKKIEELQEYVIDYIRKPFDSQDLVDQVRKYLGYLE